jgi:cytochrome b
MDLHISVGVGVIGLLLFRLGWALWGGQYVRMRQYGTSPAAIWSHLRGRGRGDAAHSAPGAAMALTTWVVLAVQVTSGLFSSDSITTDGPYARRLSSAGVEFATAIHTRTFWLVIGLIAVHVSALGWYTWRGDRIATSMWHGRRATRLAPLVRHHALRAIATAAVAAAVIAAADRWL